MISLGNSETISVAILKNAILDYTEGSVKPWAIFVNRYGKEASYPIPIIGNLVHFYFGMKSLRSLIHGPYSLS
ncbi:hypothetical protein [Leptospira stimsonii]|uniref:Uncharacterized protein n=1 Tax=Leptospira stimsonii TaxID=2202203 RepID=A0A8B3CU21_9LEPT|nr:hypothetical protein [Leptospira stimsonii]RHX87530.1 hypothetical protein DLM78_00490 [Leptospira stimsonii]